MSLTDAQIRLMRRDVLRLRRAIARLMVLPRRAQADRRLLTANECDTLYRRRGGTTAAAYRAGLLPGRWVGKPSKYRGGVLLPGKTLLVSAKRAAELFDVQYRR